MPIRVYHGSANKFDRFDPAHIGTGEGNEAYGRGLYFAENEATARWYRKNLAAGAKGHMYEAALHAEPHKFLDWNKPLSKQHPHVQKAVRSLNLDPQHMAEDPTGSDVMYALKKKNPDTYWGPKYGQHSSDALRAAGVPGIKYLDQESRKSGTGTGTSNYVVFDPGIVEIRNRYADGGKVTDDPVAQAMSVAQNAVDQAPQPVRQRFSIQAPEHSMKITTGPKPEPKAPAQVSIKSLSEAFDRAIKHHTSLDYADRVSNSRAMSARVAKHVGVRADGKTVPLLGKNAKLKKAEKGYGDEEPVTLPDGRGIETTGLALAPAYQEGKFTTCPNSASCKSSCLGKTSGNYYKVGGGSNLEAFEGPRLNSLNKTLGMMRDPEAFAVKLHDEITAAKHEAAQNGNHLGVRLNVLSDINPRVHKAIIEAHPDVSFYDYTKNNTDPIAPNHHYTYSSTGVTQEGVHNAHSNWKQMRKRLDQGDNVAMAFSHKTHLPETVVDQETGKTYRVVDGDTHDFRPLDMQPEGADGVIVGLHNKKSAGTMEDAAKDSNGFFVHYDPKEKRDAKGKLMRHPSPGPHPVSGRPMLGDTMPQNKTVVIRPQPHARVSLDNDGKTS